MIYLLSFVGSPKRSDVPDLLGQAKKVTRVIMPFPKHTADEINTPEHKSQHAFSEKKLNSRLKKAFISLFKISVGHVT